MGCATSKQKDKRKLCKNCQAPYISVRRSYSMHSHDKKEGEEEDTRFNLVALKSLGSFKLDLFDQKHKPFIIQEDEDEDEDDEVSSIQKKEEFVMGMVEAKTWSKMIDQKIPKFVPKTPTTTPPGEPEMINAWELMEDLDENISPLNQIHSFSFNLAPTTPEDSCSNQSSISHHGHSFEEKEHYPTTSKVLEISMKPLWLENGDNESNSASNETSIASEFDPEVIASFRKALEELPPTNPFHMKPIKQDEGLLLLHNNKKHKLIVYFTSLRGVRKTYEDCCYVRGILKGLGVKIDERDVSMHSGFKDELKQLLLLGEGLLFTLPKVFIEKKYIGGAEEIRRMHEEGRLEKAVEGCESVVDDGGGRVCESCGDVRFVPCETCFGSCKIYYEEDDDEETEESNCGFQPCPDCNENGLIRCPLCCD